MATEKKVRRRTCRICNKMFAPSEHHVIDDHICSDHTDIDAFFWQAEQQEQA